MQKQDAISLLRVAATCYYMDPARPVSQSPARSVRRTSGSSPNPVSWSSAPCVSRPARIPRLRGQAAGGQKGPASATRGLVMLRSSWGSRGGGRLSEGTIQWCRGVAVSGRSKSGTPSRRDTATGTTCNRALSAATRMAWGLAAAGAWLAFGSVSLAWPLGIWDAGAGVSRTQSISSGQSLA